MKMGRSGSILSRSMARQAAHLRNVRVILMTSIGLVLLVSFALGWLGWRLLVQEEALEQQQAQSRLEQSADAVLARFLRKVGETETWLNQIPASLPAEPAAPIDIGKDAVLVSFSKSGMEIQPSGEVLYHPVTPIPELRDPSLFAPAERLEFQASDLNAAR